jgi:hypothetical protein
MYTITNKELRHLKAVLRGAIDAYENEYDPGYCSKSELCPSCRKVKTAKDFLATLAPNA